MKNILLLIILISSYHTLFSGWQKVDRRPDYLPDAVYSLYLGLKCADSLNCIAWDQNNGGGYYLRRTTDGGNTWKTIRTDTSYYNSPKDFYNATNLNSIAYPNSKLFIGVGDNGLVVRTTNKGETWQKYTYDNTKKLNGIIMLDENYGIMYGADQNNIRNEFYCITNDGGISWINLNQLGFESMNLISKNLLCGITSITNKDSSWSWKLIWVHDDWKSYDTLAIPIYGPHLTFINEKQGWIAGGSLTQLIYYTDDGGHTWEKQKDTSVWGQYPVKDIKFYDENFGVATSGFGLTLITTNGGKIWNEIPVDSFPKHDGNDHFVFNVQVPSSTTAFAVEDYDYIYKYTLVPTDVKESPVENSEISIFPNPAQDFINVKTFNFNTIETSISIINEFGITVYQTNTTNNSINIDTKTLAQGIYFCKVISGKDIRAEKFVVIR